MLLKFTVHTRRKLELAWMCSVGPKVENLAVSFVETGERVGQLPVCMVAEIVVA